jgi:hypothetical protein
MERGLNFMASSSANRNNRRTTRRDPRNDRNARVNRDNLAYDYAAIERQNARRWEVETPRPQPQIRTIKRPKVMVRPAERVSVMGVLGFACVGVLLSLVLFSYVRLTALSDAVVALQSELSTLQTENVTLTAAYERTFDLETVEAAAEAAGMSKPSPSQIYYLDMTAPDSASVYTNEGVKTLDKVLSTLEKGFYTIVDYFT